MKNYARICILGFACVIGLPAQSAEQTSGDIVEPGVTMRTIYNGTIPLKVNGRNETVPFALYDFTLWTHRPVRDLKPLATGLALIQFQAGKTENTLNGKTNRAKAGDFLLLGRGSDCALRLQSEAATFEALVLGGPLGDAKLPTAHAEPTASRPVLYKRGASGALDRMASPWQELGNFSIAVQDILVGPSQTAEKVVLPGAALLEIKCGSGVLVVNGHPQSIKGGSVNVVNEGDSFQLKNGRDDLGLSIRATIIRSQ